jgi:hypothetical protein
VGLRKRRHEVVDKPGWTLDNCLPISDVVISGVPGEKYKVPLEKMRDGAVCINFSSERNFSPEVKEKASIYVPAIGKVTIAVLLRNLLVSTLPGCIEMALTSFEASVAESYRCCGSGRGNKVHRGGGRPVERLSHPLLTFSALPVRYPLEGPSATQKSIQLLCFHLAAA